MILDFYINYYITNLDYKMKSLVVYIKEKLNINSGHYVNEMSTIAHDLHLGNGLYKIGVHGPDSTDRNYPHLHIYLENDNKPYTKFNFEISLVDLLCYDEINLIRQLDIKNHLNIKNRNKCSWEGYRKLKNDFEDWLEAKCLTPGDYQDNLEFIIWSYNNESSKGKYIYDYIKNQGKEVLDKYKKKYKKYFTNEQN